MGSTLFLWIANWVRMLASRLTPSCGHLQPSDRSFRPPSGRSVGSIERLLDDARAAQLGDLDFGEPRLSEDLVSVLPTPRSGRRFDVARSDGRPVVSNALAVDLTLEKDASSRDLRISKKLVRAEHRFD